MKDRIKEIRKDAGLTQQKFAEKIGTTQNVLANYEIGRRSPSSSVINNICKTFAVSEDWLRYGTEPKRKPIDDKLSAYVSEITDSDDEFIRNFIETYMELDNDSRAVLREFSKKMAEKYK